MSQILCFAYIALAKITNLLPVFSVSNFTLNPQCSLQLDSIERTTQEPAVEILQSLYQVLMMKNFYSICRDNRPMS